MVTETGITHGFQAGDTHLTGMLSCLYCFQVMKLREIRVSGETDDEYTKGAKVGGTTAYQYNKHKPTRAPL